jgi:hypothetical protein
MTRTLGIACLFGSSFPVAIHLGFSKFEMWSFAVLIACAGYLFSGAKQRAASEN